MTAQVFQLPPHDNLTVEEAQAFAAKMKWKDIIIFGVSEEDHLQMVSSGIPVPMAVYLFELGKLRIMDQ